MSHYSDQVAQVCNHPELFARADVDAPYSFVSYGRSGPIRRDTDVIHAPYSSKNPIDYSIPELFYVDGGLVDVPHEDAPMKTGPGVLARLMNVWSAEAIQKSLGEHGMAFDLDLSQNLTRMLRLFLGLLEALELHTYTSSCYTHGPASSSISHGPRTGIKNNG
jgi:hypothetical protein